MSKYIDADRLKAEIERLYDIARDASYNGEIEGEMTAYDKILSIIASLQQEQPMPDSTQLIEWWHEDKEMLKEKDFRDDPWRLAYNAFMCGFGRGIAVKKQEQPELLSAIMAAVYWISALQLLRCLQISLMRLQAAAAPFFS